MHCFIYIVYLILYQLQDDGAARSESVAPLYPVQGSPMYTLPVTTSRHLTGVKAKKQVYLLEIDTQVYHSAFQLLHSTSSKMGVIT